ncbi:hypothetical protein Poly30_11530 [Planctomycetes bacterium Poly30]|uniref:DUF1800 domain-containing protein n=1 Tax=Saltatorellus ferox TaxID=2528018 RepID=A0A518ENJ8_9BACT|nr:hypothetical protein Poly30_11530 [Planctomycetes bacterium Poly30]
MTPSAQQSFTSTSLPGSIAVAPSPSSDVLALVRRGTFGFSVPEFERASAMGFHACRAEQLAPASIDDSALDGLLASYSSLSMDVPTLVATFPQSGGGDAFVAGELRSARVLRARHSKRQLLERMVEFWTDHFNIDGNSGPLRYLKTVDDREVVRAHALGRFRDLLGASARSGAMLYYLDNYTNVVGAPNENYARELMELHTLGVSGGYTEMDVQEVARCFTGWTLRLGGASAGEFFFRASDHDTGPKSVLGQPIPAGGGTTDGETVLDLLATHPSTAAHLASKLCTYFLFYNAPRSAVDRVAARFLQTGGDLAATMEEVLCRESFRGLPIESTYKLKRPLHLVISALRATDATTSQPMGLIEELRKLGHVPFAWGAPNGYPDALGAWGSNLLPRWSYASDLLDGQVSGTRVSSASLNALLGGVPPAMVAETLDARLFGGTLAAVDRAELQAFVSGVPVWNGAAAREAIALALSLPSFQFV